MSGKRQNIHGFERKRSKQAERRRPHLDKYADAHPPAASDENEERDHEQR
ncbi:hypothetical protein [Nocardioides sp.]|nr:hypothetical protein [Nocardioides sp.]MCW2738877.1 hypothetical protein [Nocardioides sp.]